MSTGPLLPFDRDLALGEVLDGAKATRWAETVRRSLGFGAVVADAAGQIVAVALGRDGPLADALAASAATVVAGWCLELEDLLRAPAGSAEREQDGFIWRGAALRSGLEPLGLLLLGPRLADAGTWGTSGEALARVRPGTLQAVLGPLRESLEWVLRAETARRMVSDLHLETVESGYRELVEANQRLRESEARLEATVIDLTRGVQEAAEETLRAQGEAYLREKQAGLGRLAAGIAHEINNPLAFVTANLGTAKGYVAELVPLLEAVRGAAAAAAKPRAALERVRTEAAGVDLPYLLEDFPALLEEALEGAERVSRIVRDLKDFSRVDRAETDDLDLAESLRSAARLAQSQVPEGATLELDAPASLWVHGNAGSLNQALWNLLENALWAVAQGGSRVLLACGRGAGGAWFEVEDDGPGVPEECLPLLFDPFYTTKDVGAGAGLGLAVVRDVARAHGGRAQVFTGPGRGARFRVTLPERGDG